MQSVFSCRWDWCRASFSNIDALDAHVKHEHVWPMKPLRKSEIALMRRMDLQSLHSSPITDSTTISKGVSRGKTLPPPTSPTPTWQAHKDPETIPQSVPRLLALPGQSAAAEMFERRHADKHLRLPLRERSPASRPLSQSSISSQEVVEQHLTQEDDVGSQLRPLLPCKLQTDEFADAELRWPTDDESDGPENRTRGQHFRSGSLNIPLGSATPSQGSRSQSQPIVLQTQAPYSSQDWS